MAAAVCDAGRALAEHSTLASIPGLSQLASKLLLLGPQPARFLHLRFPTCWPSVRFLATRRQGRSHLCRHSAEQSGKPATQPVP